jgi:DNA-binding winged helix-turn-helix (wHTH) protein/Tfp pilus assembly protein PilF
LIRFADLQIDPVSQQVWRETGAARELLPVHGLSMQLLLKLLEHGTAVVSLDQLITQVWAPAIVNEETVTQRIKLLRQALGDDGRQPRYVRSVRGRGYQLCEMPVTVEPEPASSAAQAAAAPSAPPRRRRYWILLVLMVELLILWRVFQAEPAREYQSSAQPPSVPALDRARYYAAIGQHDDNERAIVLFQQVLADPANSGYLQRRRTAQLGLSHAYSARVCLYNQPYSWAEHGLALADDVLRDRPRDSTAHAARAYALDCMGRIDAAIAAYSAALALQASATEQQASLASRANLRAVRGELAGALADNLQVQRAGLPQRFLDIQIARVLELLGFAPAAEQLYREQFELYPDNPLIALAYPRFLFNQGRIDEASALVERAMQRPLHPDLHIVRGELALLRGNRRAAASAFAAATALKPQSSWPRSLSLLHTATDPTQLAERLQALEPSAAAADVWPESWLEIALLRLALKQTDGALDALQRAVQRGYRDRAYLQTSALYRPLAAHPQFAAVLDQIAQAVASERGAALKIPGLDALIAVAVAPAPINRSDPPAPP